MQISMCPVTTCRMSLTQVYTHFQAASAVTTESAEPYQDIPDNTALYIKKHFYSSDYCAVSVIFEQRQMAFMLFEE